MSISVLVGITFLFVLVMGVLGLGQACRWISRRRLARVGRRRATAAHRQA